MRSASRANTASVGIGAAAVARPDRQASHVPWIWTTLSRAANPTRRGHFLEDRLDIRAQELERLIARLADEMEMTRMPIGVLEAESTVA